MLTCKVCVIGFEIVMLGDVDLQLQITFFVYTFRYVAMWIALFVAVKGSYDCQCVRNWHWERLAA